MKESRKRRWCQFSLRTLLVVVLAAGAGLGLLGRKLQQIRKKEGAVAELEKFGALVGSGPAGWQARLLGDDLGPVIAVKASGTRITDADLEHVKALSSLQRLWLNATQVSDAGLEHLKGLPNLRRLDLQGTRVTDAGLEHLKTLPSLQDLSLAGTNVTGPGLEHLKEVPSLRCLVLSRTGITDAGLEHLQGLAQLEVLHLEGTQVTPEGVEKLQAALPQCQIEYRALRLTAD